jgi:5'-nucleotidase
MLLLLVPRSQVQLLSDTSTPQHSITYLFILGFLAEDYLSLFRIDKEGYLENIEDKGALKGIDCKLMDASYVDNKNINVYQGGYWHDLNVLLGISSPDRILYVGDHIYGDILKSRRSLGWRTCLIIPELEHEIRVSRESEGLATRIRGLRRLQDDLDEWVEILRRRALTDDSVVEQLAVTEAKSAELKAMLVELTQQYDGKYNPLWGQLFKAGYENSRFAHQVLNYACLYTSKATNFALVSPRRSFRPVQDFMGMYIVLTYYVNVY